MKSRFRLALRIIGAALLAFVAVRLFIDLFSSFHTEVSATPSGGFYISHSFRIDHVTMIIALVGMLLLASSFMILHKRV